MSDLWGDLPNVDNVKTPHAILVEQGNLLSNKTKGFLVGVVTRKQEETKFRNVFQIVAPSLNHYAYSVCVATHEITLYPVNFFSYVKKNWQMLTDEAAFISSLGAELKSPEVQRVIVGLLAQIRADSETAS
jgi:hypothetical protein